MIKFLVGLVVGICLLLGAVYLYLTAGGLSMKTSAGPLPMERMLAHKALRASIGQSAEEQAPLAADEATLMAGAHIYEQNCSGCHGKFGGPPAFIAKRIYPHAPALLPPGEGVTDDPVGETHWVVKNGIRFSGMPSFEGALTAHELWQVSLLLKNADKVSDPVKEVLRR